MTIETDISDLRKRVATIEDKIAYNEMLESLKKVKFSHSNKKDYQKNYYINNREKILKKRKNHYVEG